MTLLRAPLLLALILPSLARAHPMPDIAVRSHFDSSGSVEIRVEVDPRSFEADPEAFEYLEKEAVEAYSPGQIAELEKKAVAFLAERLRFLFEPGGEVKPDFDWTFRKLGDEPLTDAKSPAVLVGSWKTTLPAGHGGYRIASLQLADPAALPMNVVFLNHLDGKKIERYAVLFPGETSFALDLSFPSPGKKADPAQ